MTNFQSPMLASDYDPKALRFPCFGSAKIDGIRAVIDRTSPDGVDPYARSGKIIRNKFIQQQIGLTPLYGVDGELVVGDAAAPDVYNKTSSGVMSADGEPDFTFWVFDLRHMGNADFIERHGALDRIVSGLDHPRVKVLPQLLISTMEGLEAFESECLDSGFEGIMLRDPSLAYKYGRSRPWNAKRGTGGELLKVKRVSHDEFEIIGFEEQLYNVNEAFTDELGRMKRSSAKDGLVPADTLGAFIGRNDSLWPGQTFNVSAGVLTHAERKRLWDNRQHYLGRIGVMKHLAHGAKDKPRHGRFNGFRHADDMSEAK